MIRRRVVAKQGFVQTNELNVDVMGGTLSTVSSTTVERQEAVFNKALVTNLEDDEDADEDEENEVEFVDSF